MKQVIISGLTFLFLSGAVASIAAEQETIKPEVQSTTQATTENTNIFQLSALKTAFKYGLTAGWQINKQGE